MQLSGKNLLNAAPARIWTLLMDPGVLARLVPGITKLEKTGDNSYKSILDIKLGPVSGSFTGNLRLDDLAEQKSFTIRAQQNSKIGNANAVIIVNLCPVGDTQTELQFEGDAKLSGLLASMGQRVIGGISNTLIKQFFNNIEKEVEESAEVRYEV